MNLPPQRSQKSEGIGFRAILREGRQGLALLILPLVLIAIAAVSIAGAASPASLDDNNSAAPAALTSFIVRLAELNLLVRADAPLDEFVKSERDRQSRDFAAALSELAAQGHAGQYSLEEDLVFRAELDDFAAELLRHDARVTSIEPAATSAALSPDESVADSGVAPSATQTVVGSVIFIQVYSPFVWGRASVGGLSVTLTLESSVGITKGIAIQTTAAPPNNYIKIDPGQLYFETVFVDPNPPGGPVMIAPNDIVHVRTTGINPTTNLFEVEDRRVTVDEVQAWTSLDQETVSGKAPPNANLIVTVGSLALTGQYLTPPTFAELTASASGTFSAATFRTQSDATYKKAALQQGTTGFVRVVKAPTNDEVYTVHGQNVFVLQNSYAFHGWAFPLPSAPLVGSGVAVLRPAYPKVTAVLRDSSNQVKSVVSFVVSPPLPYRPVFDQTIVGGDRVEVAISNMPTRTISVAPIAGTIDLGANQITGTGPANTELTVGAGRVSGYISSSSNAEFFQDRVTTDGAGRFATGQFVCSGSNYLGLIPGSFGYAGFEDAYGNFVYEAFAAPATYVMSGYPFVEGWVANGLVRPNITVQQTDGAIKSQGIEDPSLLWLLNQKLYINTYFNQTPDRFILPGDTVTVDYGVQKAVIPVDDLTAWVNTDSNVVAGQAPAGRTVRVIPTNDRAARSEVVADGTGNYATVNPFATFSASCTLGSKTEDFAPGDSGRAYLRHDDGNEVFTVYGRSMHVNENENHLDLYIFYLMDLDWTTTPSRAVTVTLTRPNGYTASTTVSTIAGRQGKASVDITDQGTRVLIRRGDSLQATFLEGPAGVQRTVTMTLAVPLITASPDQDASTVAGVAPRTWAGVATLNVTGAKPVAIAPRSSTAYPPMQFVDGSGRVITLVQGHNGQVSMSDNSGHRVWIAWGLTAITIPPKINQPLQAGATQVCGTKAGASTTVNIHDVTGDGQDDIIGTGTADANGNFCIALSAPLQAGQVILAEAGGTYSQPAVVMWWVSLPDVRKNS